MHGNLVHRMEADVCIFIIFIFSQLSYHALVVTFITYSHTSFRNSFKNSLSSFALPGVRGKGEGVAD